MRVDAKKSLCKGGERKDLVGINRRIARGSTRLEANGKVLDTSKSRIKGIRSTGRRHVEDKGSPGRV